MSDLPPSASDSTRVGARRLPPGPLLIPGLLCLGLLSTGSPAGAVEREGRAPGRAGVPGSPDAIPVVTPSGRSSLSSASADTLRLPGLRAPVRILRDPWGVAHIYAENEHDLFFAQGWSAARDRLFQLEIWRRQATGTASEFLGPRAVERDVGARLFAYRGDLEEELRHYHPRGPEIVGAFVEGVNARVAQVEADPSLLPPEFEILELRPGRWTPEVVVSRHQGLLGNLPWELHYARAVARVGPEKVREVQSFGPGEPDLSLDPGLDPERLFDDILRLYEAWHSPIRFRPEDVAPRFRPARAPGAESAARRAVGEESLATGAGPGAGGGRRVGGAGGGGREREPGADRWDIGSNNWVVRPELTLDGHAVMANDPHRVQQAPSLRYLVHLSAPGWNVIGAGEPAIPGVSIGHNEHGAWGLTVFPTDGEDLYVYETNPDDPLEYRYGDGWKRMETERDTVRVEGGDPVPVELRYTRHGPVVHRDTVHDVAWAVRAAWREPGGAPYLASLRMDQARSWEEFREACTYSHIPGENMVWADTAGNIGWQAVGIAPIRPDWSGLVPVPGDGRYEWADYLPIEDKPHVANPASGFWATANENLVPRGYPHRDAVGWEWSDPFRSARIREVLASGRRLSLGDHTRLQTDVLSLPARNLVPLLEGLEARRERAERARRMLLGWDRRLEPGSAAAAAYVAWERRLRRGLTDRAVPEEAREHLGLVPMSRVVEWLLSPPAWMGEPPATTPTEARNAFLLESLEGAVADVTEKLGLEMASWRYGGEAFKHVRIPHPLSEAVRAEIRDNLEVGPAPRGGNSYTVNNTGWGDNQRTGASFRIVAPAGKWDAALAISAPGQAGDPASPHYDDLFPLWAADRYFPLYYSREAVGRVAEETLTLAPAGS